MRRLVTRQLVAGRGRTALTVLGVALAVGATVAAFVVRDSQRTGLDSLADRTLAAVDFRVTGTASDADAVAGLPGVAEAQQVTEARWNDTVLFAAGRPLATDDMPVIASTWSNGSINPFVVVDGAPPSEGEFVLHRDVIERFDLVIGERYRLGAAGVRTSLVLVGATEFADAPATGGALFVHVSQDDRAALGTSSTSAIAVVVGDGTDPRAVADLVASSSPGAHIVGRDELVDTTRARYRADFTAETDVLATALSVFAAVTLLVAVFIVANTFTISIGQRTTELGLLRVIGGSSRQVRLAVLGESAVVGAVGALSGLPVGLAIAHGIELLFNATGDDLPAFPLALEARTVVLSLVLGVGVSTVAAVPAARRAASGPALDAISGASAATVRRSSRGRVCGAVLALAVGALALGVAVTTPPSDDDTGLVLFAAGAVSALVGIVLASPLLVGSVMRAIGRPLARWAGAPGRLAARNAARHPLRTSRTSAALMIGLAVATATFVVGQSVKETFRASSAAIVGDYVVDLPDGGTFEAAAPAALLETPTVDRVAAFRFATLVTDGRLGATAAVDFASMRELYRADIVEGGAATATSHAALILDRHAAQTGLGIGDVVDVELPRGPIAATITGVYRGSALFGTDFVFDDSVYGDGGERTGPSWMIVGFHDDVSEEAISATLARWSDDVSGAEFNTATSLNERLDGAIDDAIVFVNVLTALAIVVALFGIANTMALSMLERIREIGLARAAGMDRRQVRRMVRLEGALVGAFGAALGVAFGLVLGAVATRVLPRHWADTVAVPAGAIGSLVVIALLCGVAASMLPARRASRRSVLSALTP